MAKSRFEAETSTSSSGTGSLPTIPEPVPIYEEKPAAKSHLATRFRDSFKRNPELHFTQKGQIGANGQVFDLESAAQNTAESPLARKLKGRHLQMIAIGGSIGTSSAVTLSQLSG